MCGANLAGGMPQIGRVAIRSRLVSHRSPVDFLAMPFSNDTPVHIAIDFGASSGRVMAGGLTGGSIALEELHRFENRPLRMQDSLQWNIHGLWQDVLDGLTIAAKRFTEIQSVGVDSWGVDFAILDSQGLLAGPVRCYRDSRMNGILPRVFEKVPRDQIFDATGLQFMEISSIYQLFAAVERNEPSLGIAEQFLMIGDLFHWLLSGQPSIEVTNASTTQLLDPRTKAWRHDVMDALDIPTKLFIDPTEPGTRLGTIQPSVQAVTGLGDVPVIVPATHDTASAVLSVPAANFAPAQPDWCYISSGTWSLMGVEVPEPSITEDCSRLNFTNEGGVRGSTRLLKNIGGLWVFQQIRRGLQKRGEDLSFAEMVEAAETASPFQCLINPDESTLVAPDDMIDAIAEFAQRTGQAVPTDTGVLCRAALEGLALRYRVCLGMLETITGNRIETIHIVGGGSQNALLCQMTADACDRTVVAGPVEATAIGNVVMQMIGADRLESIEQARGLVRTSFANEIREFHPVAPEQWCEPAERFEELA